MVNPPLNRVNVVNGGLTRWKPPRPGRVHPRRRWRRLGWTPPAGGSTPAGWVITLVALKNNFWGLVHRGGRLVWSTSAGAIPGYTGSKRGRLQAAGAVAALTGVHLRRGPTRVGRRGPRRGPRWEGIFRRRPRRWTRRGRWTRRAGRITTLGVHLVGWTRDKRWRYALGQLAPRGRVWLGVVPRRVHNGLRGRKQRRC